MSNYKQEGIKKMTKALLGAGFRVFVAKDGEGEYGFYTDNDGSRVIGFQYDCCDIAFSGNYNSTNSGSGWRLEDQEASYEDMFSAPAPHWAIGRDPKWHYTTLEEHQDRYQSSSKYKEITEFNVGDNVTFDSYGKELPATVKSIQKGINGDGLHVDGSIDGRTFYNLTGDNVLTCTSGLCIKESVFYQN
jgi:hypothetical protein